MSPVLFVLSLGTVSALVLVFAFKTLPEERWQVLAAVPLLKTPEGSWTGLNLTYYGLFVATAEMLAMPAIRQGSEQRRMGSRQRCRRCPSGPSLSFPFFEECAVTEVSLEIHQLFTNLRDIAYVKLPGFRISTPMP